MPVGARERLIAAAVRLGQRDGWSRLTVADVLTESGVARRSLYTHFPDGVPELTVAAVRTAAEWITAVVEQACEQHSLDALVTFTDHWAAVLTESDFQLGCPILAAVTGSPQHPDAVAVASRALATWEATITAALVRDGATTEGARQLGVLVVAGVEGAVARCLGDRSTRPLEMVHDLLTDALRAALPPGHSPAR